MNATVTLHYLFTYLKVYIAHEFINYTGTVKNVNRSDTAKLYSYHSPKL